MFREEKERRRKEKNVGKKGRKEGAHSAFSRGNLPHSACKGHKQGGKLFERTFIHVSKESN